MPQFLKDESPTLYVQIEAKVKDLIAFYKTQAVDGWTRREIWDTSVRVIVSLDDIIKTATGEFTHETKRDVILGVFGQFFDEVLAPIDIPYIPEFIEKRIVDPKLRVIFLDLVGSTYDALAKIAERKAPVPSSNSAIPPVQGVPLPSGWVPY